MTTPRLFADYAALPTAHDRELLRRNNERHQLGLFELEVPEARPDTDCPTCAGKHIVTDCPHGTAPTLPEQCHRTYSDASANPYLRRNGGCITCGKPRNEHDHPADTNAERRAEHDARLDHRETDRLTDTDRATITDAIDTAIRINVGWTWAGMPTLERIAWHAIGCDARDLRGSELLWIEHECRRAILAAQPRPE